MRNKIRYITFVVIMAVIILIIFSVCRDILLYKYFYVQKSILNETQDYTEYEIPSDGNNYFLKTEKVIVDNIVYVTFNIKEPTGKIIYNCSDKYRVFDLKDIKWESFDIVVESSDVGTIIYKYENGTWIRSI